MPDLFGVLWMSETQDADGLHYAWTILAIGTLVVFGSLGLARFGYTVILPSMQGPPVSRHRQSEGPRWSERPVETVR